jgi:drug/metabolite transporter (DMT)-like permease
MTPLFSLLFGWLLLSEKAGLAKLGGAALVGLGIVLVNRSRPLAWLRRAGGERDRKDVRPSCPTPGA